MRLRWICAGMFGLMAAANAQAPSARDIRMFGDRFKPLTYEQMTAEQKVMIEHLLSGDRGGTTTGPFNVLLRSPEMGDLAQQLGAYVRFHSRISAKERELAILITARSWTAQYEWIAHKRLALQAGLSPAVIDSVAVGKRPAALEPGEQVVYNFCVELLTTKHVSDSTFQAALNHLGERGVVDLIGLLGYYDMVSMLLNVDRYPIPDGSQPELKALP